MSYPVNVPIVFTTTLTPIDGNEPTGVSLTLVDPNSVTHNVAIEATTPRANGSWNYRGYFMPTVVGTWIRTWAGTSVLSTSVAPIVVE